MNGVVIRRQQPLSFVNQADIVLFGSGRLTRTLIQNESLMSVFRLDSSHQLIGSQCSGALFLKRLGLVETRPICTDSTTRSWLVELGASVLEQPFAAAGNIATAWGCLSAHYFATWVIYKKLGREAAADALSYVAPVEEQQEFIDRALAIIEGAVKNHSLEIS